MPQGHPEDNCPPASDSESTASLPYIDEPVFILTAARSGSTLLRRILDSHEDLACPSETGIPNICAILWDAWVLLDQESSVSALSEKAKHGIRGAINSIFRDYLTGRGKARWCNKSLGTAVFADRLAEVYDKAKFICLYRHAMDMINSGIEATPFGVRGYGFEQFNDSTNTVAGLADYWINHTAQILEFEKAHEGRCIRVYYEELAVDHDRVTDDIFKFIGVPSSPEAVRRALAGQGELTKTDLGDYKIRGHARVSDTSVGRGMRVPTRQLHPNQRSAMNELLGQLGYAPVDGAWDLMTVPPVLLTPVPRVPEPLTPVRPEPSPAEEEAQLLRFEEVDREFKRRIGKHMKVLPDGFEKWNTMAIVAYSLKQPRVAAGWRIDRQAGTVDSEIDELDYESLDAEWVFTADVDEWRSVLLGIESLANAVRRCSIRHIHAEPDDDAVHVGPGMGRTERRALPLLAHVLGLTGADD